MKIFVRTEAEHEIKAESLTDLLQQMRDRSWVDEGDLVDYKRAVKRRSIDFFGEKIEYSSLEDFIIECCRTGIFQEFHITHDSLSE